MKPLLVFALVLSVWSSNAQNFYNIDSLKSSLEHAPDDRSKVSTLAALSFNYAFAGPDTGVYYGQQAIALAKRTGDEKGEALALFSYGWALWAFGDYDKAADVALTSLQSFQDRKDYEMTVSANNLLAVIFRDVKDYPTALGYSNAAKKLVDSLGIYKGDVNPVAELGSTLTIRSTVFLLGGQLDSANDNMKRFFSIYPLSSTSGFPVTTMGRIAAAEKDYRKALYYFKASIDTTTLARLDILDSYVEIAGLYLQTGAVDSSIYYCREVIRRGTNTFYKRAIRDAVNILANCYKKKNLSDSAIKYLELGVALSDSLYNQEKIRSIQSLSFNAQLQRQEEEAAKAQFRSRLRVYVLLGLLGVFLVIGVTLLRSNTQRKKANALLQAQKDKVETTLRQLKATQAQLIQQEKMASLGELTAGIAHEIQNPLNFVNNFSAVNKELLQELKEEIGKGNLSEIKAIAGDLEANEEKITHHGERADSIVKGMLQHARTSTGEKQPTDINRLADEYLRLSYQGMRAKDKTFNAAIETSFDNNIGAVNVVPQDIGRVLLNLFNNAFYAVAKKKEQLNGTFEPVVAIATGKEAGKVVISVRDNGTGMSSQTMGKIFQPFFTTKPTGEGTGLGLSLSYDIVTKGHGGNIKVESKEGEGTTFIIGLPQTPPA